MNFAYYPGCSARGSSKDYEMSTQAVCKALDMRLVDIPDWNCCGSTPAHAVDTELSAALCVRNLDIAAQQKAELLLTPCPSCLSNLRMAAKRMENPAFRSRVDELLDGPSAKQFPPVTSVMQGIAGQMDMDAIAARVRQSLKGLKLVAYYGCLMSRPAEVMNFGDPENPTLMEEMMSACGAEMLDFPLKTACCGASFGIPERPMTAKNSGRILELATRLGAVHGSGDVAAAVADKDAYSHYLPPSAALAFCSAGLAASSRRSSPSLRIRPSALTHSLFRPSSSSGRSKAMPIIWVK